jgi:hypothetical protein
MTTETTHEDAQIIKFFGGPAALARKLELNERHATQRVSNWIKRGIPPAIRVKHRRIFDKAERALAKQPA